jgi:hypothetical protein
MIESFSVKKNTSLVELLNFLKEDFDYDFYYTHENARIYISNLSNLKHLLKSSHYIYTLEEKGEYAGIVLLWKSHGGGKERYYIKLKATNPEVAKSLITVLLWNTRKEVYAKIRKDNKFLSTLRNKGFKFLGGRGVQVLLSYKPKRKENYNGTTDNFIDT